MMYSNILIFRILQIGKNTFQKLEDHQYEPKKWTSTIYEMVTEVMQTELEKGFSLSLLKKCDRLEEMEFYFPTSSGFLPELAQRIPQHSKLKNTSIGLMPKILERSKEMDT